MRRKTMTLVAAALMAACMATTAYAGWEQNGTQWKYKNTDNSYSMNVWQWIDGNGDGVAECYYFDVNGYMLSSTTTPDGYTVNETGAWIVNNVVQQKVEQTNPLVGTWKGYEELTGYSTTYIFNSNGTVHYDITSNYFESHMSGDTTYTFNGSQIFIESDEFYVNFAGNMKLEGTQIIAEDEGEDGAFNVTFLRQ